MATAFNGTDLDWTPSGGSPIALNVVDMTYSIGEVPRVDITHAASTFKTYGAGIPEADSVSVTHLVSAGNPGGTGAFSAGSIGISGTFRIESVEQSGSIDNPVQFTTTFVRTA